MITEIEISNYKSIDNLTLDLGRINVFIGENGAGKSNVLEAIALAGAAAAEKLDNEFLTSRGIRVTNPELMRPAFPESDPCAPIAITIKSNNRQFTFTLTNDNTPYSKWDSRILTEGGLNFKADEFVSIFQNFNKLMAPKSSDNKALKDAYVKFLGELLNGFKEKTPDDQSETPSKKEQQRWNVSVPIEEQSLIEALTRTTLKHSEQHKDLGNFVIYSPENSCLRGFEKEGQIEPLGINGEGLLKLINYYAVDENSETLRNIKESLRVLDWFENFQTTGTPADGQLLVQDRFLDKKIHDFDYKSTNEGFFFLLFYFTLFNSDLTPPFFAVDNIDASLNPKLCQRLMIELVSISKRKNKQAIFTTHNPAVLDGLNLDDDEQRLFVISRKRNGSTRVKRIMKPKPVGDSHPKLSELFLNGMIGGLPKGF